MRLAGFVCTLFIDLRLTRAVVASEERQADCSIEGKALSYHIIRRNMSIMYLYVCLNECVVGPIGGKSQLLQLKLIIDAVRMKTTCGKTSQKTVFVCSPMSR